ncbi:MAG: RidA family protein [Merismopedia sp. SIO2A8]|nr:RidA family protein [Symploca sp. SIO2B6]NET50398.1 RidA family protein [Merismopedia sp. SIO2A8]
MSIQREVIVPKGMEVLYEKYHYCPGVKVGNTLYISGQVGRDDNFQVVEDTEAQFVQTFENVKKVLTAAGATFDDVVEMVTYHVTGAAAEMNEPTSPGQAIAAPGQKAFTIPHLPLFINVKDRYFTQNFPTWTGVGVTTLSTPGLIVEIKCTAVF